MTAMRLTSTIPIVFGSIDDPVGSGIVADLSSPGGNATGLANQVSNLMVKQLELVREVFPDSRDVALLTGRRAPFDGVARVARSLDIDLLSLIATDMEEIEAAFLAMRERGVKALVLANDPYLMASSSVINAMAASQGVAVVCPFAHMASSGCLLTYGINLARNYTRVAVFVDRILKGDRPHLLPVEVPVNYHLIVNMMAAKRLSITIPDYVLVSADEVLE